jgi:ABC-type proline/glycine betaine transport system ATPase subunit
MSEYKNYCKTRRVVGYVVPEIKAMVSQEAYDNNIAVSDIVCIAMKEYYDRRPELVQTLKERQGKTRF